MPDSFDTLKTAATAPSIDTTRQMLAQMDGVFSGLVTRFPKNATFKTQSETLAKVRAMFDDLAALPNPDPRAMAKTVERAETLFKSAGMTDIDLDAWGLI